MDLQNKVKVNFAKIGKIATAVSIPALTISAPVAAQATSGDDDKNFDAYDKNPLAELDTQKTAEWLRDTVEGQNIKSPQALDSLLNEKLSELEGVLDQYYERPDLEIKKIQASIIEPAKDYASNAQNSDEYIKLFVESISNHIEEETTKQHLKDEFGLDNIQLMPKAHGQEPIDSISIEISVNEEGEVEVTNTSRGEIGDIEVVNIDSDTLLPVDISFFPPEMKKAMAALNHLYNNNVDIMQEKGDIGAAFGCESCLGFDNDGILHIFPDGVIERAPEYIKEYGVEVTNPLMAKYAVYNDIESDRKGFQEILDNEKREAKTPSIDVHIGDETVAIPVGYAIITQYYPEHVREALTVLNDLLDRHAEIKVYTDGTVDVQLDEESKQLKECDCIDLSKPVIVNAKKLLEYTPEYLENNPGLVVEDVLTQKNRGAQHLMELGKQDIIQQLYPDRGMPVYQPLEIDRDDYSEQTIKALAVYNHIYKQSAEALISGNPIAIQNTQGFEASHGFIREEGKGLGLDTELFLSKVDKYPSSYPQFNIEDALHPSLYPNPTGGSTLVKMQPGDMKAIADILEREITGQEPALRDLDKNTKAFNEELKEKIGVDGGTLGALLTAAGAAAFFVIRHLKGQSEQKSLR